MQFIFIINLTRITAELPKKQILKELRTELQLFEHKYQNLINSYWNQFSYVENLRRTRNKAIKFKLLCINECIENTNTFNANFSSYSQEIALKKFNEKQKMYKTYQKSVFLAKMVHKVFKSESQKLTVLKYKCEFLYERYSHSYRRYSKLKRQI